MMLLVKRNVGQPPPEAAGPQALADPGERRATPQAKPVPGQHKTPANTGRAQRGELEGQLPAGGSTALQPLLCAAPQALADGACCPLWISPTHPKQCSRAPDSE